MTSVIQQVLALKTLLFYCEAGLKEGFADIDTELLYSYSLKCPDTKRRDHTTCDKRHIQTKKHQQ